MILEKEIELGTYHDVSFHYIMNENNRLMINATEIANYLKINLSDYLSKDLTKRYIKIYLDKKPELTKYKVNGIPYEQMSGQSSSIEDLILINQGVYYFHKFLIHDMLRDFFDLEFHIDDWLWELMKKGIR